MSKKGAKIEYIILALVIIVLGLYLYNKRTDKINYQLPTLTSLEKDKITKIEIIKKEGSLTLQKVDDKWKIQPKGYPADENQISSMTDAIAQLTLTTMVSETGNYSLYGLDEANDIHVKAYEGGTVVRDFEVGNAASTHRHTYVRIKDDKNVYHARDSFRDRFEKKANDLIDKVILKVEKQDIGGVEIEMNEKKLTFTRQVKAPEIGTPQTPPAQQPPPPQQEIWLTSDGTKADNNKINALFNQFINLNCDGFIEDKAKDDFQNPFYSVTLKGPKQYILSIFAKIEEEGEHKDNYPAVSSENPLPFYLSSWKAEQLIKSIEVLQE